MNLIPLALAAGMALLPGIAVAATPSSNGASAHPMTRVPLPRPRPLLEAPLPRPRPANLGLPASRPAIPPSVPPAVDPEAEARFAACRAHLAPARAVIAPEPPVTGPEGCAVSDLVRLEGIRLANGRLMRLVPAARLRCGMAEALADWVRIDVDEVLAGRGGGLAAMRVDASFDCRPRNNIPGAPLSEHATGNALDVRGFGFADESRLVLTDAAADKELRERLARSACARFQTVLGPGSDGFHEEHVHLDVRERRNGYRICQWEVR